MTILYGAGHREAVEVVTTVRESSTFDIRDVPTTIFTRTETQSVQYDDPQISFIDHLNSVLCDAFDTEQIFGFEDDFATLGLTRVPVDTGEV